jgi:uncharacterized membrane protein YoaK (UPF0700 family)
VVVALAFILAAVAGFVDICAFVSFGVYAANMTGNAISFAIGATGRAGSAECERAVTIAFFFAGALTGAALVGDPEAGSPRALRLGRLLTLEATLLLVVVQTAPARRTLAQSRSGWRCWRSRPGCRMRACAALAPSPFERRM